MLVQEEISSLYEFDVAAAMTDRGWSSAFFMITSSPSWWKNPRNNGLLKRSTWLSVTRFMNLVMVRKVRSLEFLKGNHFNSERERESFVHSTSYSSASCARARRSPVRKFQIAIGKQNAKKERLDNLSMLTNKVSSQWPHQIVWPLIRRLNHLNQSVY